MRSATRSPMTIAVAKLWLLMPWFPSSASAFAGPGVGKHVTEGVPPERGQAVLRKAGRVGRLRVHPGPLPGGAFHRRKCGVGLLGPALELLTLTVAAQLGELLDRDPVGLTDN